MDGISGYTLMHGDVEVAEMSLHDDTGTVHGIGDILDPAHLPVGVVHDGIIDGESLRRWWRKRSIPAGRTGLENLLQALDIGCPTELLPGSMGLSLSDQYWIRGIGSDITWGDVNFFDNPFSGDIGDLLFGYTDGCGGCDPSSPDNTTEGNLKKRWEIIDGRRVLVKSSNCQYRQEAFNERVASIVMDALGVDHVTYDILWVNGVPYSSCECFITTDTEYVTADRVCRIRKHRNDIPYYDHYVGCCSELGVDIVPDLDRMIVVDYLMMNNDRHLNNFGLVRRADTLEWLGAAPVYDTGASLGHTLNWDGMAGDPERECKPFARTFEEEIDLVSSFDWVDIDALRGCMDTVEESLQPIGKLSSERMAFILDLLGQRIDLLEHHVNRQR
ncbi:MAG: hypothetical protein IJ026_01415 [Candidatus Methanomethylophilaceae archaeon]|nr:hypothetical protein [Candidatus Methanomethylophilaceae archaeon]